ncbi:MAG: NUDIX hydrolase [Gemmatimonadetes bacterium]|nr:MAG: NUDIX hydrolase [Gemmatimonadota bacterium]
MSRDPIPTWYFAVVVVRHRDRFLLVQERKHGQRWYLPAGRAEPGESLAEAAARETLEESGVKVRLTGVLRVEHSPSPRRARLRAVYLAEPSGDTTTKQEPDDESLRAEWVSLSELDQYEMRGPEVEQLLRYVANGGKCSPLDIIQEEGMPYVPTA